ncbi:G-D-S-L family lipolytic protein [Microcoleus sp. FACHB-1515]|nr:G-D-S-L family lipolytic protein [Microcoleus sp. FACHB-1515]
MRDRPLRPLKPRLRSAKPSRWQSQPLWVLVSLLVNGFLLAILMLIALRDHSLSTTAPPAVPPPSAIAAMPVTNTAQSASFGERQQLNYQQWLDLLQQEARAVAANPPQRLTVLAGDSLSLWFPPDLLPSDRAWLNQGISGETSAGLLRRLDLFKDTQPQTILVLIGINDLIRQINPETIVANQRQILKDLRRQHPGAQIVLQSILPHGVDQVTWEGRDRLLAVTNDRIRQVNRELEAIAREENVYFLDLNPLFADAEGNLRPALSTDGLHLSAEGYIVWRTALQLYSQMELEK